MGHWAANPTCLILSYVLTLFYLQIPFSWILAYVTCFYTKTYPRVQFSHSPLCSLFLPTTQITGWQAPTVPAARNIVAFLPSNCQQHFPSTLNLQNAIAGPISSQFPGSDRKNFVSTDGGIGTWKQKEQKKKEKKKQRKQEGVKITRISKIKTSDSKSSSSHLSGKYLLKYLIYPRLSNGY